MRRFSWEIQFGLSLILLSLVLYLFHYALFEDARHILLWTTTSVAFLPIDVSMGNGKAVLAAAFVLFRVFDVAKLPFRQAQHLKGGV